MRSLVVNITMGLFLVLLAAGCAHNVDSSKQLAATSLAPPAPPPGLLPAPSVPSMPRYPDFNGEQKSEAVRRVAEWVMDSGDHHGMPFAVLDKVQAKVFVFNPDGRLRGAAPALLGLGKGDDILPDIGDKKLSEIRPEDRVTQAGRFVSYLALNYKGTSILWIDYDSNTALHRVITTNPKEHRLERLDNPKPSEHRISFGCVNVPIKFFDNVVEPAFTGTYGVVYVLPETRSLKDTFKSYYDVEPGRQAGTSANLR
jgi:hypothetical protein